jgi:hypothetical protein
MRQREAHGQSNALTPLPSVNNMLEEECKQGVGSTKTDGIMALRLHFGETDQPARPVGLKV